MRNRSSKVNQEALQLRTSLKREEEHQCKDMKIFEWWLTKEDRPVKEMYRSLKKKLEEEHIPLLKKPDGKIYYFLTHTSPKFSAVPPPNQLLKLKPKRRSTSVGKEQSPPF